MAMISPGRALRANSRWATLATMARVLPAPGPATTNSGPSGRVATARCGAFRAASAAARRSRAPPGGGAPRGWPPGSRGLSGAANLRPMAEASSGPERAVRPWVAERPTPLPGPPPYASTPVGAGSPTGARQPPGGRRRHAERPQEAPQRALRIVLVVDREVRGPTEVAGAAAAQDARAEGVKRPCPHRFPGGGRRTDDRCQPGLQFARGPAGEGNGHDLARLGLTRQ